MHPGFLHHSSLTGTTKSPGPRVSFRAPLAVAVGTLLVVSTALGCSSDDSATRGSTNPPSSTSLPTPSTVDDADFDSQARTAELMIHNAGADPCAVIKAFSPTSSLPTPVNPKQAERGVRVVAGLFQAAAATAPPEAAAEAQVLSSAATALLAEGAEKNWDPAWVVAIPKTISDPTVTQAFATYQSTVAGTCRNSTTTTPAGG